MSKENDEIEEVLQFALSDMSIQNMELHAFWHQWIRDGWREARQKGYAY